MSKQKDSSEPDDWDLPAPKDRQNIPTRIDEELDEFAAHFVEKKWSPDTIESYQTQLRALSRFSKSTSLKTISFLTIKKFFLDRNKQGKHRSYQCARTALQHYYVTMRGEDFAFSEIEQIKPDVAIPPYLSPDDFDRLFAAASKDTTRRCGTDRRNSS